jgi:hypothetical protein
VNNAYFLTLLKHVIGLLVTCLHQVKNAVLHVYTANDLPLQRIHIKSLSLAIIKIKLHNVQTHITERSRLSVK